MPQDDQPISSPGVNQDDGLPYAVELWDGNRQGVEKILARAFTITLARAIFRAALEENPGRRIVLRHGARVVEDNGE